MKCEHAGNFVSADICQGDAVGRGGAQAAQGWTCAYTVQWCQMCGAYRLNGDGPWIEPRSLRANIVDSDEDRAARFVTNGPVREQLVEEFERTRLEERERAQAELAIWRQKAQAAEAVVVSMEGYEVVWRTTLGESRRARDSAEAYGYQRAHDEMEQARRKSPPHEVGPSCPPGCDGRDHTLS